jgi:CheY-like chemotaxis protein
MYQPARLAAASLALLLPLLAVAPAAAQMDDTDYSRLYATPEKPIEFWNAIQVELDRGSYEVAGKWLRALVAKKPADKDLLEIADKDGAIAVMRLRNVRNWTSNPKVLDVTIKDAEARVAKAKADKEGRPEAEAFLKIVTLNVNTMKDAETLIESVQAAVRKRAGDTGYIRALIAQLRATPEERSFATRELYSKVGAAAVPHMLDDISKSTDAEERLVLRKALEKMGDQAIAPLVAGLDGYPAETKLEILDLLRNKFAASANVIMPFLWYPSANRAEDPVVRKKAREVLSDFSSIAEDRLIPAKVALVREADKYYRGEVTFSNPAAVGVWRWDPKAKTVIRGWPGAAEVTASQAEEYYGLKFAREALDLDPDYLPAQAVFLSLALQKAGEKHGVAKPINAVSPALGEHLSKANLDLLLEVLDRALREEKPNVAIPVLRVIGQRGEVRAKRPLSKGEPGLVRALYSRDPRVRLAAVEAIVAIPGDVAPATRKRVLEILGHLLTPSAVYHEGRKVLVAVANEGWRPRVRQAVVDLGARPIAVTNGRDAMRALRGAADIDAILLESTLPEPGLAHLLAQLRADADVKGIPVVVAAVPESRAALDAASHYRSLLVKKEALEGELRDYRERLRGLDAREAAEKREVADIPSLTGSQRSAEYQKIEARYREQREKAEFMNPGVISALKRADEIDRGLEAAARRYNLEGEIREAALTRFVARYHGVSVVPTSALLNAADLGRILKVAGEKAPAFTPAEQAEITEAAVRILRDMAFGRPPGFDVQPLTGVLLDALRTGRMKPASQERLIEIATRLPGARPQQELANVTLASARPLPVRLAAAKGLLAHRQRYGPQLPPALVQALRAEAGKADTDPLLKERLDLLTGAFGSEPRSTGERLRDYDPAPVAPLPVPKKEEKDD